MTDELRRAAERLRAFREGRLSEDDYPARQHGRDEAALADAYLAQYPADDGEPVTEEWLRAVGFEDGPFDVLRSPRLAGLIRFEYPVPGGFTHRHCEPGWNITVPGMTTGIPQLQLTTRGHVRRLAAALGTPLQE